MSIDIVNLIESNPITKLNGDYQSKLVEKVKNTFSNYEQQLFLSSFYCYLKYDPKNDFVIDLDDVWKWLDFSQKIKAKQMLEKNFTINKDYKLLLYHEVKQTNQTKGGHNKETFMLNVETFKKFCLKAGTKKADEIHDYFIKLENIMFEITKEECDILKQQLQQVEEKSKKEYEVKLAEESILEREKILLKEFETIGSLFYIIKVKSFENGQYIVKVGESRIGILARYKEHKSNYDECLLLDCFLVNRSKDFETFIKDHDHIRPSKVTDLPGHKSELELFLIGKNLSYKTLLNIVNKNIKYFNDTNNEVKKLELELEILKTKQNSNIVSDEVPNGLLKNLLDMNKLLINKIDKLEQSNKEILDKLNAYQTKIVTGFNQQNPHLGPRLQKINPETLHLVKVYETVTEAMNENKIIKRPSINKAIQENTIYCGFRWLLVERNLDPNIIHNIEPTKQTKSQNLGYIAKLNIDKTEIINVYLDRKTAADLNGYASSAGLDNVVKNFTLSKGHYYVLYDSCDDELKENFIIKNNNQDPILYKNGIGQFDAENNLVKEFICKYDCIKTFHISDKTLQKALDKQVPYNGHIFKYLEPKISCL
jgi:phage anti-repressor protein